MTDFNKILIEKTCTYIDIDFLFFHIIDNLTMTIDIVHWLPTEKAQCYQNDNQFWSNSFKNIVKKNQTDHRTLRIPFTSPGIFRIKTHVYKLKSFLLLTAPKTSVETCLTKHHD